MKKALIFLISILVILYNSACSKTNTEVIPLPIPSATPSMDLDETIKLDDISFNVSSLWNWGDVNKKHDYGTEIEDTYNAKPYGDDYREDLTLSFYKKLLPESIDENIENIFENFKNKKPDSSVYEIEQMDLYKTEVNGIKIVVEDSIWKDLYKIPGKSADGYNYDGYERTYIIPTKNYTYYLSANGTEYTFQTMCNLLDAVMNTLQIKSSSDETHSESRKKPSPKEVFDYFGVMAIEWLDNNMTDAEAWQKIAKHFGITVTEAKNLYKQYEDKLYNN